MKAIKLISSTIGWQLPNFIIPIYYRDADV